MAIQGTFTADFSSFQAAVENAVIQLRGFEASTNKVESSLTRMTDNFSGRKIITEATLMAQAVENVGGISHLTEAELAKVGATAAEAAAKLRAMGQAVPTNIADLAGHAKSASSGMGEMLGLASSLAGALGVAFSVGAVVNFGKEILADADALTKMHDKSGISVEGLQAMRIAGDDAGVALDSMVASVNMLQRRLGGDNDSANRALVDLGINVADFKALDGAGQMAELSDAVRGIDDPLRIANDLSALFGKSWADQLPALKRGFAELGDSSQVMSAKTVKALDDVGDAWAKWERRAKGEAGGVLAWLIENFSVTDDSAATLAVDLGKMADAAEKAAPHMKALVPPGLPKDLDDIIEKSNSTKEGIDEAVKAAAAFAVVVGEVDAAGKGWRATIDSIDGAIVEEMRTLTAAGVPLKTLETYYGLTAVQGRAFTAMLKDETEASQRSTAEAEKAAAAEAHWADVMGNLDAVGKGWKGTLDTIDGTVVQGIKYYLEAGVSQKVLAEAYGLTDAQVKAVSSSMRDNTEATKSDTDATLANAAAKQHLYDVLHGFTTGIFDAKGNAIDSLTMDRYSQEQFITVAAQLHTTADAVRRMVESGAGSLDDILAAGLAAIKGNSQAAIDLWVAMGGSAPGGTSTSTSRAGSLASAVPPISLSGSGAGGGRVVTFAPGAIVLHATGPDDAARKMAAEIVTRIARGLQLV